MKPSVLLFSALLSTAALSAAAQDIHIPKDVLFDPSITIPERLEVCTMGTDVAASIRRYGPNVVADGAKTGRYVDMAFTEIHAPGGSAWSGPKWLEITGTMRENGKDIAAFRAKRFSTGGAFGVFKGTCGILKRITKAMGQDIAAWLRDPVDGAELGDAQ